ncbi:MAG TPA: hypothetical protein VJI96_00750 [Candidatus Andersenbacteria bacterium]|nr:hypothetical protein [Candidatus Andersenbacteria bacterium]
MAPSSSLTYVLVAPCIPLPKGGHTAYTYHSGKNIQISVGSIVRISFGKRKILGVVLQANIKRPRYPTKPIASVLDVSLTPLQMQYANVIARLCHGGIGFTLRLFIPHAL